MADEINDPRVQETFRQLREGLAGVREELTRARAAGEASLREAQTTRQTVAESSRRQGERTRQQAQRVAPGTRPTTPAEGEQVTRQAERTARAEETIARQRGQSGRLITVESRASRDRLSATERIAQAERDIARARAGRAADLQRELLQRQGIAGSMPTYLGGTRDARSAGGVILPGQRGSIGPNEVAARVAEAQRVAQHAARDAQRAREIFTAGYGGGGAGGGGRPPAPPGGAPRDPSPGDFNRHIGAAAQHVDLADRATAADRQWRGEMERLSRTIGINGDDLRRHGALTTEFISAAARGQVEIRELGYQVGSTIGKFAGWTAAASLVFGAAGAIRELGTGAMESVNAVNQVQRIITDLDTDQAQADMRDLAREFNLPIADVGASVYESAKIFQDYGKTIDGTRAALFAMKVGELSAADANRYLNSIVRAFPGAELADVFDTINQAQNRFGGSLDQIVAGVARAGNAFRNVGGDYASLVALIQTGSLQTGRPGLEIATGIQRSAEQITRPNKRAKIVDILGVDPADVSIVELYEKAMEEVAKSTPERAAEIARALSTPELATSRILPILQAAPRYREIREEITSGRQQGSAQRELERTLQAPSERLKAFGIELQNFGSALAQSGLLEPILLLVDTLGEGLQLASQLLGVFASMPGPLRTAASFAVQIGGAIALMRRFNVGGALPEGMVGARSLLGRNPAALERAEIMQGLSFQRQFLQEEQRQTARRAGMQLRTAEGEWTKLDRMSASPDFDDDALERQRLRAVEASARYEDLWSEHARNAQALEQTQKQTNDFQRTTRGATGRNLDAVRRAALDNEIYYRGNIGPLPVPGEAPRIPGAPGTERGSGLIVPVSGAAERTEGAARAMQAEARELNRLQRAGARAGASGRVLSGAAGAVISGLGAAQRGLSTGAGSLARLGGSIAAFLGPLDLLLVGALVAWESVKSAQQQADEAARLFDNAADPGVLRSAARRELGDDSNLDALQGAFADVWNATIGRPGWGPNGPTIQSPDQAANEQAEAAQREADSLADAQRKGVLLRQDQIRRRLAKRLGEARSDADRERAIRQAEVEMERSYGATFGVTDARGRREVGLTEADIRRAQASLEGRGQSLQERLESLTTVEDLVDFALRTSVRNQRLGFTGRNRSRMVGVIAQLRQRLNDTDNPAEQQAILQQIDSVQSEYAEQAERRLDGIEYASPERAGRMRQRYLEQMRRLYGRNRQAEASLRQRRGSDAGSLEVERERQRADEERLRDLQRQQGAHTALGGDPLGSPTADLAGRSSPELDREIKKVRDRMRKRSATIRGLRSRIGNTDEDIAELARANRQDKAELQRIEREQGRAQYEAELSAFDARTERLQAEESDPAARARLLSSRMRARTNMVRRAVRQGVENASEIDRAVAREIQAQRDVVNEAISLFTARTELATAQWEVGLPTEGAKLARGVSDAQRILGFIQGQPGVETSQVIQAQKALASAQAAQAAYVREQAQELIRAQTELAVSNTEDPIKQAELRAQEARRLARFARTPAERARARADVNNRERDRRNTIQQERADQIDFDLSIENISRETAIAQYEGLLRSMRGNRELRRQIRQRIHSLRAEANNTDDLTLSLGDIRIPTAYELRRLTRGGIRSVAQQSVSVINRNTVSVSVTGPQDYDELGRVLESSLQGTGAVVARAGGNR